MKLLIITNLFPNSVEPTRGVFNKQQFLELAKLCELKVIAPIPWHKLSKVPNKEMIEGIDVYHPRYFMIPKIGRSLYGIFFFLSIIGMARRIEKTFCFDEILATWAYPDGFGSCLLAKLFKKPIVIKVHGSDINITMQSVVRKKMILYALKNSARIIAVSNALKDKMISMGALKEKIVVIPNGVDTILFSPMDRVECRKKLNIPNEQKIVLFMGNLKQIKGLNHLIEAMSRLPDDIRLILVGSGGERDSLRALAERMGIQARVNFAGSRLHSEIPVWINASDVLCLPSLNEGCPNVVLEAQSCGIPVVATRVGGVSDIIRSSDTGLLVEPAYSDQLSDALKCAIDKKWDRQKIRDSVIKFDWKDNAHEALGVLERAAGFYGKRSFAKLKDSVKAAISFFIPKRIVIYKGDSGDKKIALTFDDGPSLRTTHKVLEILREKNVKATFFLIGNMAEKHNELVRDIAKDGHCIGAHSYAHPKHSKITAGDIRVEIDKSVGAIEKILNFKCILYRTPGGEVSISQLLYCYRKELTTVFWSVDSQDGRMKNAEDVIAHVTGNGIGSGDIILFHDDNDLILSVLPGVIDHFKTKGYDFVTVEDMIR